MPNNIEPGAENSFCKAEWANMKRAVQRTLERREYLISLSLVTKGGKGQVPRSHRQG